MTFTNRPALWWTRAIFVAIALSTTSLGSATCAQARADTGTDNPEPLLVLLQTVPIQQDELPDGVEVWPFESDGDDRTEEHGLFPDAVGTVNEVLTGDDAFVFLSYSVYETGDDADEAFDDLEDRVDDGVDPEDIELQDPEWNDESDEHKTLTATAEVTFPTESGDEEPVELSYVFAFQRVENVVVTVVWVGELKNSGADAKTVDDLMEAAVDHLEDAFSSEIPDNDWDWE